MFRAINLSMPPARRTPGLAFEFHDNYPGPAGERRYSAMRSPHSFLECGGVKRLRFAAVLAFDQRSANTLRLGAAFLFPPDKIADIRCRRCSALRQSAP